ncbi:MAG: hypothetical protein ACOY4I_09450 [Bacillota bacterium]
MVVMVVGTAAFLHVIVRVRMAAGILLFVLCYGLAAAVGPGVLTAHGIILLSSIENIFPYCPAGQKMVFHLDSTIYS